MQCSVWVVLVYMEMNAVSYIITGLVCVQVECCVLIGLSLNVVCAWACKALGTRQSVDGWLD
jgi:hypothetical protein